MELVGHFVGSDNVQVQWAIAMALRSLAKDRAFRAHETYRFVPLISL